jgi:hypothetical protein
VAGNRDFSGASLKVGVLPADVYEIRFDRVRAACARAAIQTHLPDATWDDAEAALDALDPQDPRRRAIARECVERFALFGLDQHDEPTPGVCECGKTKTIFGSSGGSSRCQSCTRRRRREARNGRPAETKTRDREVTP